MYIENGGNKEARKKYTKESEVGQNCVDACRVKKKFIFPVESEHI